MEIRNILLSLEPGVSSHAVACAVSLAQRFRARITGLAAAEPSGVMIEGPAGIAAYDKARADIEEALTLAKADFEGRVPREMVRSWVSAIENPTLALRRETLHADLLVIDGNAGRAFEQRPDVSELVLTTGRPIIVLGETASSSIGSRVVVAWKDGREARRAVADALPFLAGAELVRVLTVDEGDYARERYRLDDIVEWLRSHDVAATGDVLPLAGTPSATVLGAATALDANLMVAGGYGHSRLRELILGGMTRELLDRPSISLLLSN